VHARGHRGDREAAAAALAPPAAAIFGGRAGLTVPGPRVAGLLTLAMLVAGFVVGTAGGPQSAASATAPARRLVLLAGPPALGAVPPPAPVAAPAPPAAPELPKAPAVAADRIEQPAAPGSSEEPSAAAEPEPAAPAPEEDPDEDPETPSEETEPIPKTRAKLPPVAHVWVITLADRGLRTTFGPGSSDPYLRDELVRQGVLLNNFHATARGTAANGVALISGQGANAATDGDCAQPTEVTPGTVAAGDDLQQVKGDGCVYPSTVGTLPEQLTAADKSWKAYVEDVAPGRLGTSPNCEAARSPRNPFAYFKSLTDAEDCPQRIVGTSDLAADLADPEKTPSLSWIVPDACHDGREAPCAPGAPSGLGAASVWLRPVLDQIRATKAYTEGGLIVLLADRAPMDGPAPDTSARKGAPAGQGGGLVPALLLSPFVTPGQQVAAAYDHFSLLASLEDLLGVSRLGQAGRPRLRAFGPRVFGAYDATKK